ncbi:MAG: hypothetical protein QOK16_640 [Solirubrobacteraceae bacterium]|nr:hypothetical protein [Solirubrobacteraceae bacterium]
MLGRAERWLALRVAATVALIWLAAFALAILVSHASVAAAALPDAIASGIALVGFRWPTSRRVGAACALVATAVHPAKVLPWTLAAICMTLVVDRHVSAVRAPSLSELDRYLERCRRRGEPATVLFLDIEADVNVLRNLLRSARVTDSLVVSRSRSRFQVYGLLDGTDHTRATVTARFGDALTGAGPMFGWATYPTDGLTLDVLLDHARKSAATESASSELPAEPATVHPGLEALPELGAEHA